MAIEITDNNFEEVVLNSKLPVLVDFWAAWCGPCKVITLIIDELSSDYKDKAVVGKLDLDTNKKYGAKYSVLNIPTVLIFKEGKLVKRLAGIHTKNEYMMALNSQL